MAPHVLTFVVLFVLCSLGTSRILWYTFTTDTNSANSELLPKPCWKWEILWNKTHLLWRALLGGHGTKHVSAHVVSPPLINSFRSPCTNFSAHYSLSMKIYLNYLLIWQGPYLAFTHQGKQGINLVLQLFGQGLQELHKEVSEDRSRKSSFSFILWWVNTNYTWLTLYHVRAGSAAWACTLF